MKWNGSDDLVRPAEGDRLESRKPRRLPQHLGRPRHDLLRIRRVLDRMDRKDQSELPSSKGIRRMSATTVSALLAFQGAGVVSTP